MVLQRDLPAAIYGTGDEGRTVIVTLRTTGGTVLRTNQTTVDPNGIWRLHLNPTPAGGPHILTITDGLTTNTCSDVLVGEVWLMSGQSNMAGTVGPNGTTGTPIAPATFYGSMTVTDNYPNIRARFSSGLGWVNAVNFNIQFMYAQAYFFARAIQLAEGQNVPVAFYQGAMVNTPIQQWLDPVSLAEHPDAASAANAGLRFNTLIQPILGYTFRGMIWDQGENNAGVEASTAQYGRWLRSLITNWRTLTGNPDMLVIVTQLPTIRDEWHSPQTGPVSTGSANDRTARIRQAQFEAMALPNVFLNPIWDISDGDIHPPINHLKAERTSRIYRHRVRGETSMVDQGPTFFRQEIQGDKLVLYFAHVGTGLALDPSVPATLQTNRNPVTDLLGMAIAGTNNIFYWADGILGPDYVTLSSTSVPAPTQARYVWADDLRQKGNLINSAGLPAPCFNSLLTVPILATNDADGDAVPDYWESTYYGSPTGAPNSILKRGIAVPASDVFITGLNPLDPDAIFEVTFEAAPTGAKLVFPSVTTRRYDALIATDLAASDTWQLVPDHTNRSGTGEVMEFDVPETNTNSFFSVCVKL
jgi:sialate O-acetylesterase